jgi:hypothetical protein
MRDSIHVDIASPPDREKLVAMIVIGDEQWAEINQEQNELELEIYPRQDGKPWIIPFRLAVEALERGRNRLLGKDVDPE